MSPPPSAQPTPGQKLDLLRRLDRYRHWASLDDQRLCLQCGKIITGQLIQVTGGTGAFDPLRANCPTQGCASQLMDWALPDSGNRAFFMTAERAAARESEKAGASPPHTFDHRRRRLRRQRTE